MTNQTTQDQSEFPSAAREALRQGNKIEAIKILRRARGVDLKDAKDAVEAYVRRDPALERSLQAAQAEEQRWLLRWVLGLLALAVAGYLFLAGG